MIGKPTRIDMLKKAKNIIAPRELYIKRSGVTESRNCKRKIKAM